MHYFCQILAYARKMQESAFIFPMKSMQGFAFFLHEDIPLKVCLNKTWMLESTLAYVLQNFGINKWQKFLYLSWKKDKFLHISSIEKWLSPISCYFLALLQQIFPKAPNRYSVTRGQTRLNANMYRIKLAESPWCPCCKDHQTLITLLTIADFCTINSITCIMALILHTPLNAPLHMKKTMDYLTLSGPNTQILA